MWLRMKSHSKLVHGCIVYTQRALIRQQFYYVAPAMYQPNSAVHEFYFGEYLKHAVESSLFRITFDKNEVSLFESRE